MAGAITYRLSGGNGNSDPDASLGGVISATALSGTALNNLFDNVIPTEIDGVSYTDYRGFNLLNSGDATLRNMEFFFVDTDNSESIVEVWLDSTGTQSIADEDTEPTGASGNWTTPVIGSKLALGDLAAGASHRLWIKRTIDADATNINDDLAEMHTWGS